VISASSGTYKREAAPRIFISGQRNAATGNLVVVEEPHAAGAVVVEGGAADAHGNRFVEPGELRPIDGSGALDRLLEKAFTFPAAAIHL